ncbi:hypothetical protein BD410DRAFT_716126 [Rickenella mellea]|uniref:C2H2-type domain-containing protein n=1 Tax=Rickenella mellea TaxID=50990 RepID=A0A4Y7QER0_9AGAM|nr:hypothetical protein BD410DRAFT_716126 [Rickenella mellea]
MQATSSAARPMHPSSVSSPTTDAYHFSTRPNASSHVISPTTSQHYSLSQGQDHGRSHHQIHLPQNPPPIVRSHGPTIKTSAQPHSHNSSSQSPTSGGSYKQPLESQYPASPQRPYACDLCALSFSRQHDLKRHKETHSGERPYECNGGCGKTFTRKDALKRHQIVKSCGSSED